MKPENSNGRYRELVVFWEEAKFSFLRAAGPGIQEGRELEQQARERTLPGNGKGRGCDRSNQGEAACRKEHSIYAIESMENIFALSALQGHSSLPLLFGA
jgi:hypothetical protein